MGNRITLRIGKLDHGRKQKQPQQLNSIAPVEPNSSLVLVNTSQVNQPLDQRQHLDLCRSNNGFEVILR